MVSAKLIPKALDFGQTCWNCLEILIFTGSAAYQARWKPQYSKIGGIYDNFPYLFQRLEQIRLLSQNIPQALNLALGAVYGAFIGDSIGSYVEFSHAVSAEDIAQAFALEGGGPHRIGPGQVTDDSELAISLARGLLYSENQVLNLDQITKFYGDWIKSNPFDVGNTTANALMPLRNGHSADRAIRSARYQNQRSISNGSMMRCTPMAIWAHRLPKERIVEVAKLESSITHSNATAQNATACYVFAITYLINHPGDRQGAYRAAKQLGGELGLADWFDDIENQRLPQGHPQMGYVKIGFTHAFHHLRQGSDYDTAIRQVLAIAGDTDTNAAIVGGLIGAAVGFNALSEDYKLKIEARAGDQSLRIERPDFLIPRDLKHLVTRLYELAPMDVNKVVIANRELNLGEEFQ